MSVLVFADQYLDVIFSPEGDVRIDDRDELDAACASGELTKEQADAASAECERILREYCEDIHATDMWCAAVRQIAEDRIAGGEPVTISREVRELEAALAAGRKERLP